MSRHLPDVTKEPDGKRVIGSLGLRRSGSPEYQNPFFADDVQREMEACAGVQVPIFDLDQERRRQRDSISRRSIYRTYASPPQSNVSAPGRLRRFVPTAFRHGNHCLLEILANDVARMAFRHDPALVEPDGSVTQALYG